MDLQLIQTKIYTIRNQKVILDYDLAELYCVETRELNQSVKRNIDRFPEDFMFQLHEYEWQNMSSQIVMTSKRPKSAFPFAFTEHGVTMLSGVLRSKIAIETNIQIVRAFVAIRNLLFKTNIEHTPNLQAEITLLKQYIEEAMSDQNDINEDTRTQIELINQTLAEMQTDKSLFTKPRKRIGFETVE